MSIHRRVSLRQGEDEKEANCSRRKEKGFKCFKLLVPNPERNRNKT
jgi:hypothetical protein